MSSREHKFTRLERLLIAVLLGLGLIGWGSAGSSVAVLYNSGGTEMGTVANPLNVQVGGNLISTDNSSTSTLSGGAAFTGSWEDITDYATITVTAFSDVASATDGLLAQFSTDASNVSRSRGITVGAGDTETLLLPAVSQYFRVVYTNGAGAQSAFRLQTFYSAVRNKQLNFTSTSVLDDEVDVELVRTVNDIRLDLARGLVDGSKEIRKFGRNPSVSTGGEALWANGGDYNFLSTCDELRIASGGDANDTAAGSGCREVTIEFLDSSFDETSEVVATAGASASSTTSVTACRINRAYCSATGTYGGDNDGAIVIETEGGTTVGNIAAGVGQTQLAIYTVPNGKKAYLTYLKGWIEGSKNANIYLYQRRNADDTSAPMSPRRIVSAFDNVAENLDRTFESFVEFSEKTDVWVRAASSSGTASVTAEFDLIVVPE